MTTTRRAFLAGTTAILSARPALAEMAPVPFAPGDVIDKARALAARSYQPRSQVPQPWLDLSYEQYKSLWFRFDRALWRDTDRPYEVDFFHPGLYFPRAVIVHEVKDGQAWQVPFDLANFDKTDKFHDLPVDESMGFSGIRLRTELDQPGLKNEFCVFQGASYFRAIGLQQIYGLSARGLALKTADPMGEEFPEFIEFWLEAPEPGQTKIILHALLDSPSVAGAYRFEIQPGKDCVMDVQATLFPRIDLDHIGLGPLTSMFLYDQTNRTRFDDFRPAVHDSDGLLIRNGNGELLWRPLANPVRLQVSSFVDQKPRGFGLMQRARKLSDFADLEALYHRRPGLWVEPLGDWGKGSVVLVEIPTEVEIFDNIVAYWRPCQRMKAGSETQLAYRLTWCVEPDLETNLPRVINTAMGARHNGAEPLPGRFAAIDFEDHPLFDDGPEAMTVHVASAQAETSQGVLQRNPETGGLRLVFAFDPGESPYAELRAQLRKDGQMASEVWLYRWTV